MGDTTTVSATATSGLAVSFSSWTPTICTVSGSTVSGIAAGTCTIAASQAGNANYVAATPVTRDITIGKGSQSISFGAAPSITVGGTGTVSATGGASGNAVTFTVPVTTSVCTISGSTITSVTAGTCTIAADQAGDANYNVATQVTQNIIIKDNQTISFGAAPTIVVGETGPVSATATSGLTVSFSSTITPGVCTVSGSTVTGIAAGTCTISANQAGNANYAAATPVTQDITIGQGSQTISFGAAPTIVVGGTGTVSATATSGLAVSFSSTITPGVCTVSGTSVTGITVGTCTISANQAGDANYAAATQVTQDITIILLVTPIISASTHTVVLRSDGTVVAWGYNFDGQLGDGTATNRYSPVAVMTSPSVPLTGVVAVVAGLYHTVALKADGTVVAWGYNLYGQLGDGTKTQRSSPVAVMASPGVPLTGVVAVAAGSSEHTVALKADGSVVAWGRNDSGQLGDGTATDRWSPVTVMASPGVPLREVVAVAAVGGYTVALKSDSTVVAWGYNAQGQMGDGTKTQRSSPVAVMASPGVPLSGVAAVAAGNSHTVAIKADGTVVAWGSNNNGQLGDGGLTSNVSPAAVMASPGVPLSGVVAVAAGGTHTVALKADGTVVAWGRNAEGQLGDGTMLQSNSPVAVSGSLNLGVATAASFSPASLDFGLQDVGTTSAIQTLTLTNAGNIPLSVPVLIFGGNYAHTTTCGGTTRTLLAGVSCTIDVTFTPTVGGARSGTLKIVGNGAVLNSVSLSGTGMPVPIVSLNPTSLSFADQNPNTTSAEKTITLSNTGSATLNLASITASGEFARTTTCGATLAAGANCTISTTFTPTVLGVRAGAVTISSNAAGSPHSVSVSGTGVANVPAAPTIGTATPGNAQATVTFTAPTSNGGSPITGYTVTSVPAGGIDSNAGSTALTHTITGLFNGTAYTFIVRATNGVGASPASAASNSVTPKANQNIGTIIFSPATLAVGGITTASATATSGLAVTYTSTTTTGICTVSGSTVTGVTAGTCSIAANQAGNASYNAAPQVTQNITVGKAGQTIAVGAAPSIIFGGTGTISATGGASGNAVTFTSTTTSICTVSGSTVTGVTAGTCTIAANQAGNASYNAAPQVTQNITVGKANQTIAFGAAPTVVVGGAGAVTATGGASGNAVIFTSATTGICTVSGSTVTGVTAGTCTIAANQTGNANYNAAPQATQNITVGKRSQTIGQITFSPTTLVVGGTTTASATATSGLVVTFSTASPACTATGTNGSTIRGIAAGACIITANQAGNASYNAATPSARSITVSAAPVPAVSLNRTALIFAARRPGTISPAQAVTLTNTGAAVLNITGIVASGDFARTTTCAATLAAGASCTISVTFTATAMGARAGLVTLTSNAAGSPHRIILTGTGKGTRYDFNGDGKSDILWRNPTSGANQIWFMNGGLKTGFANTTALAAPWAIAGVDDFNGDGKADILWRHPTTRQTVIWLMNGITRLSSTVVSPVVVAPWAAAWNIAGTGDFNGDGKADLLWRSNLATGLTAGANQIWLMNGAARTSAANTTAAAAALAVAGVADFNGDGKTDILWRNAATGQDWVWLMNGAAAIAGSGATGTLAAPWIIAGTGDFNADGKADILWRNTTNGLGSIWFMNGKAAAGATTNAAATVWSVAGVADFNGDGKADITWRSPAAGATQLWLMNGATRSAAANLTPAMLAPWSVAK